MASSEAVSKSPKSSPAAPGTKGAGKTAPADWERIELDYRAGVKTLRQIADENGITHGAINKRAKRDGWERDLSEKIQRKADALVSKAAVSIEVSKVARAAERAVVDANAQAIADVRLAHRRDIHRTRKITNALLDELEQQADADTVALLEQLGENMRNPDENGIDRLTGVSVVRDHPIAELAGCENRCQCAVEGNAVGKARELVDAREHRPIPNVPLVKKRIIQLPLVVVKAHQGLGVDFHARLTRYFHLKLTHLLA
ncbi:hypothetical protein [Comamonas sp.]|uniref:hypothetical protein n=1 Tax=Comamonas sp. TaxID=34028 RepID=UPI003A913FF8